MTLEIRRHARFTFLGPAIRREVQTVRDRPRGPELQTFQGPLHHRGHHHIIGDHHRHWRWRALDRRRRRAKVRPQNGTESRGIKTPAFTISYATPVPAPAASTPTADLFLAGDLTGAACHAALVCPHPPSPPPFTAHVFVSTGICRAGCTPARHATATSTRTATPR